MKTNVVHFLRKYSQLKASFIKNQVENHIRFSPFLIYKFKLHKREGGFADIKSEVKNLNLSLNNSFSDKIRFKILKTIGNDDVKLINDYIRINDIKLLHFHYGTDAGIYYPFLKTATLPSVVSFYGYDCSGFPNFMGGYGKRYLNRRVFPYVTKVLAMSPDMKADLVKIGCPDDKIIIHHHGNDIEGFYLERDYSKTQDLCRFLIISGLTPQKGHLFLLKSFKEALKKNSHIRLTIVGGGELHDKINNYIKSNDLSSYVSFDPSVVYNSEKHLEYLKSHDVFIHPSVTDMNGDKEGIPGAIIEAMSSGLPVISTYHAGIPCIIKNGESGVLVNEFDYEKLSGVILEMAGNRILQERYGKAGQQFAINELDLHKKEEELEEIYLKILNN